MHIPVLLKEVVENLNLKNGSKVVDCTLGDGGHAAALLEKIKPNGQILAIDTDKENIERAQKQLKSVILVNDNFVHLKKILIQSNFFPVDAILMDLGWSTTQFEKSGRGFSFQKENEPLDMRLGNTQLTAAQILNNWSEEEIGKILHLYGEEEKWRTLAHKIVIQRKKNKFATVKDLLTIIGQEKKGGVRLHPATKVFQALRIAINEELDVLKKTLPQAVEVLAPQGRLAVITFHSLEDRLVKNFFQEQSLKNKIKIINKKPLLPLPEEVTNNPRSRSAKLRVVEKITHP